MVGKFEIPTGIYFSWRLYVFTNLPFSILYLEFDSGFDYLRNYFLYGTEWICGKTGFVLHFSILTIHFPSRWFSSAGKGAKTAWIWQVRKVYSLVWKVISEKNSSEQVVQWLYCFFNKKYSPPKHGALQREDRVSLSVLSGCLFHLDNLLPHNRGDKDVMLHTHFC